LNSNLHRPAPNPNTVHLGLRSPHMVADLMEEGRRWDALLLACLPAFV
jgi:hypothetical protein